VDLSIDDINSRHISDSLCNHVCLSRYLLSDGIVCMCDPGCLVCVTVLHQRNMNPAWYVNSIQYSNANGANVHPVLSVQAALLHFQTDSGAGIPAGRMPWFDLPTWFETSFFQTHWNIRKT
jgi:hypothetical protein